SRKIIVNCLKKMGCISIVEATNGADALGKMYSENINFIITECIMPNMDGLKFVKAIKEEISFKDIPILMIMTRSIKSDVIEALKAGVDNFIIKPFTPIILKEKIDAILEKKHRKL
ncbi:response regulator, partial [candidate division KSB1 bacterium]